MKRIFNWFSYCISSWPFLGLSIWHWLEIKASTSTFLMFLNKQKSFLCWFMNTEIFYPLTIASIQSLPLLKLFPFVWIYISLWVVVFLFICRSYTNYTYFRFVICLLYWCCYVLLWLFPYYLVLSSWLVVLIFGLN